MCDDTIETEAVWVRYIGTYNRLLKTTAIVAASAIVNAIIEGLLPSEMLSGLNGSHQF